MTDGDRSSPMERLALMLVPARDRDALVGDLDEEQMHAAGERVAAVISVGTAYQGEPYRDDRARAGILVMFIAGFALLRLVPLAADGVDFGSLDGLIWRGAAAVWTYSTAVAATGVGLFLGRMPLIPEYAASARWHVATLLAVIAGVSAGPVSERFAAAALLFAATLIASRARRAAMPPPATP